MTEFDRPLCRNCLWHSQCGGHKRCEDYVPETEELDNMLAIELMESERDDFRSAWLQYVGYDFC